MPPDPRVTRTKQQQREQTTRTLVHHARRLFASHGYARVTLSAVAEAAGVTKGALYHHFTGKEDLFRAVLRQVHEQVADRVATAAPDADDWTMLVTGCRAFLAASVEPDIQRIMLIDAPSVLGWGAWRELDAATSMQHLEAVLTRLVSAGVIVDQPVAPLVHLLSGAMNEAALWIAGSNEPARDLADAVTALDRLLASLRK